MGGQLGTDLSPREREVIELMAQGLTNARIAARLGISFPTAKTHVSNIIGRLGVTTREEAVAAWRQQNRLPTKLSRGIVGTLLGSGWKRPVAAAAAVATLAVGIVAAILLLPRSDDAAPTAFDPTPAPTGTPVPVHYPTPVPVAAGPYEGDTVSTVLLVDTATGAATTVYHDEGLRAWLSGFIADRIYVYNGAILQFDRDGERIQTPGRLPSSRPDLRWEAVQLDTGGLAPLPSGALLETWDQYIENLDTGERRLVQEDLFFCRGCGSRFAPQWSPSGRYLVFGEYGGDQRYWLYDIAADQLRPLGRGTLITNTPTWSPTEDLLAYRIDQNGPALLEDMETGEVTALPLEWPVRFDFDGGLLYSPAYRPENNADNPGETTVYDIARGEVIARLPGISLRDFLRTDSKAVRITERGTVAVLQQAEGCDGTAIYIEWALRYCVVAGTEGQIAADGRVAVARRGERVPRSLFNTNDGNAYWYDIDIVDPSGAATTIVTGAASFDAPQMEWSADGSRLLLMWPRAVNVVLHP